MLRSVLRKSKRKHHPTHLSSRSPHFPLSLNVEWTHVTHVFIANSGANAFLKTIRALASKANLTYLSVHNLTGLQTHQHITSIIELPSVYHFSIGGPNAQDTCKLLLHRIKLPSLQTFSINNGAIPVFSARQLPMGTLALFISRSVFPLVELELGNFGMPGSSLTNLLWYIPSLVKLTLETITYADDFFPAFSQANSLSNHGHEFLPLLLSLKLAAFPRNSLWRLLLDIWNSEDFPDIRPGDDSWPGHEPFRRGLQVSLSVASANETTVPFQIVLHGV
ncbi:hypothetical protein D9619_012325 [Psilocybe cf. subviscida]|uniref:Uncharacterized protein n=1 Tax=Psilocybe cf. subviscida TaxID=2480587 RepID=A0A8H5ARF5_9AGAR|nr:hypothetical protein D9619_012325 [Psilocybe cf. subviscida]